MFKQIISKITDALNKPQFDASIFNDPIAMTTAWTPLSGGGSNFKTATLHQVNDQRIEFRASTAMKAFAALFMVVGLCLFAAFTYTKITSTKPNEAAQWIPIGMGLVFALAGAGLLYNASIPVAFDLSHGYYCKNRKKPEFTMDPSRIKNYAPLENVHALQIIAERCTSKNSSYMSYELNLVLKDGSRLNAIDHGNQQALRADAQTIASFINKPLWDAS